MNARLLGAGLAAALSTAPLSAQRLLAETFGSQIFGRYGQTLAAIDDIDGDGVKDLVIGEPFHDYSASASIVETGAVYLRSSRTGAIRVRQLAVDSFGYFGTTVAALGDVNGDGVPDFAGGSPAVNNAAGRVRVFSGANGVELWRVDGETRSELGTGIAGIGDGNGDGRADVAISAPENSNQSPYSFVRFLDGTNAQRIGTYVSTIVTRWGHAIAEIGDLSGDGLPDLIVGEPLSDAYGNGTGRVTVLDPRRLSAAMPLWHAGPFFRDFENVGGRVAAAGDLDGDGRSEVLASGTDERVYVLSGANGALRFELRAAIGDFGHALSAAGDFDGDGWNDIAIGAPSAQGGAGVVRIYDRFGRQITELVGAAGSGFGSSIAAIGDWDRDGRSELAIGAPLHSRNGSFDGRVSIHGYRVPSGTVLFGAGCGSGSAAPDLYPAGVPAIGELFELRCTQVPAQALGFWMIGLSSTQASFGALPFDLAPFGFSGCSFLVSHEVVLGFTMGSSAYARLNLSVPNQVHFLDARYHAQLGCLVPGQATPLRLSQGIACRVGHP
ncbi:MAG: FG-GAP repeat protein [Planctomycetes bacterium]|nr:FG-GAP repeat protein [Planctomycetota bacterium]